MKIDSEPEIDLRVNVLLVEESTPKYCVEVLKESGDRFEFDEVYKDIRDFFGGHANAKE